jgi:hypothetical protein
VRLEGSTKPQDHRKYEIFWTNIASTMACPDFKNGPKNGLGPLGVNLENSFYFFDQFLQFLTYLEESISLPKKV